MAAAPAAVSTAAEIHRIHKLPALATKLNQISENGKEGFARRVSRYLSGEGEKNEWEKVDLVCKEGNLRDLTSIDRAGSRNGAYTKGRATVYADICSASAQAHGHRNFDVCKAGTSSLHAADSAGCLANRSEEDLVPKVTLIDRYTLRTLIV